MSDQIEEILEDREFERAMADKQHKLLVSAIEKLAASNKGDDRILMAIKSQEAALAQLVRPSDASTLDSKALDASVEKIAAKISAGLEEIKKALLSRSGKVTMTVNRDRFTSMITTITIDPE